MHPWAFPYELMGSPDSFRTPSDQSLGTCTRATSHILLLSTHAWLCCWSCPSSFAKFYLRPLGAVQQPSCISTTVPGWALAVLTQPTSCLTRTRRKKYHTTAVQQVHSPYKARMKKYPSQVSLNEHLELPSTQAPRFPLARLLTYK